MGRHLRGGRGEEGEGYCVRWQEGVRAKEGMNGDEQEVHSRIAQSMKRFKKSQITQFGIAFTIMLCPSVLPTKTAHFTTVNNGHIWDQPFCPL